MEQVGVMLLARQLGDCLGAKPSPELTEIEMPQRPTKRSVWTPEAWAEMQAIYRGEVE